MTSRVGRLALRLCQGLFAIPLLSTTHAACTPIDCTHAALVSPAFADPVEKKAIAVLQEEAEKRIHIAWKQMPHEADTPVSFVTGTRDQLPRLLSPQTLHLLEQQPQNDKNKPEGFSISTLHTEHGIVVVIAGNDHRGLLFGIGYVLRKLEMEPEHAILPQEINLSSAPEYPVRGHQIGYRFKNNTYDAWTVAQFDQQTRDLAIFGNNTIQVIAPNSDDNATSPLFPAPTLQTLIGICNSAVSYGLDFDLYYPEMAKDYSNPATVEAEVRKSDALFRALPHIDALYVPGGDPGHTEPKYLIPLVEKEAEALHKYHPHATVWISAQGFNSAWYTEFYSILQTSHPSFLTGIFVGPQSRDSFPLQRAKIPTQYALQAYPDIGHVMHAQFAMPEWDPAFAFSEGREPIDPRPFAEMEIYRTFMQYHSGFVTYSEGVNDDVNKFIWDQLGWSAKSDPVETLRDYGRYFIGPRIGRWSSNDFAAGILALERNWQGPAMTNASIDTTLLQFRSLEEAATPDQKANWRFQSALYRAYYDAYIRERLIAETHQEQIALEDLMAAPKTGADAAIRAAHSDLQPVPAVGKDLRNHIVALADTLFHSVGLQLSVEKYGASGIERGANLDRVDVNLNNRAWLNKELDQAAGLPSEEEKQSALAHILHYADPGPGGYYDDLGDPNNEPHLVPGKGAHTDPQLYATSVNGIADKIPDSGLRISTITYAETLYDTPIELVYPRIDPNQHYRLRVTYGGEDYTLPIHLTANNSIEIHAPLHREGNPETLEFDIPREATATGRLDLQWTRPVGVGGGGRGLQVAEVWLFPVQK